MRFVISPDFSKAVFPLAKSGSQGFTLAEMIIAMTLIGIIAIFTVPKFMSNQEANKKTYGFKQSLINISQTMDSGLSENQLLPRNLNEYFFTHANYLKACDSLTSNTTLGVNQGTGACWTPGVNGDQDTISGECGAGTIADEPALLFHSGVVVMGLNHAGTPTPACMGVGTEKGYSTTDWQNGEYSKVMLLDYNNEKGPNEIGQDQLLIGACLGAFGSKQGCLTNTYDGGSGPRQFQKVGTIVPYTGLGKLAGQKRTLNENLFKTIMATK